MTFRPFKLITLFSLLVFFSFQPVIENEIDVNQFDSDKLEQLIITKVNALRKKKNAPMLLPNSVLQKAAQDQSAYLLKKKKLTHSQPSKNKKRPIDRTDFYGGKFTYVGENVAYTYIGKSVDAFDNTRKGTVLKTYPQLAEYFYLLWKNSPPHYKTMKDKGFDKTGVRFSIDKSTSRVYATQVFAK